MRPFGPYREGMSRARSVLAWAEAVMPLNRTRPTKISSAFSRIASPFLKFSWIFEHQKYVSIHDLADCFNGPGGPAFAQSNAYVGFISHFLAVEGCHLDSPAGYCRGFSCDPRGIDGLQIHLDGTSKLEIILQSLRLAVGQAGPQ